MTGCSRTRTSSTPSTCGRSAEIDPSGGAAQDAERQAYNDRIRRDFMGGVRSGVNGTPTFYINGVRHDGGYSLPESLDAVDHPPR